MGSLMNEVEAIVERTGAAVAFGAHYSKGNQSEKDPLDRISGSGVFARDPDTIMGLTAHEEENCYTVHSALRNFPGKEPFVIEWDFPLFKIRSDLNAHKLKQLGQKGTAGGALAELRKHPQGLSKKDWVDILKREMGYSSNTKPYDFISELENDGRVHTTRSNYFPTN